MSSSHKKFQRLPNPLSQFNKVFDDKQFNRVCATFEQSVDSLGSQARRRLKLQCVRRPVQLKHQNLGEDNRMVKAIMVASFSLIAVPTRILQTYLVVPLLE